MRVEIDDDVFVPPHADTPALLSLFRLGLERHRLVLANDPAPGFEQWSDGLDEWSRELSHSVLDRGMTEGAREPSDVVIHVKAAPSDGGTRTPPELRLPELRLDDALDVLQRPYRLLLENARSDGNFLLALMTDDERDFLLRRIDAEWLEFENCGGLGGLLVRSDEISDVPHGRLRCSALFDSDAAQPGQPSQDSAKAALACGKGAIHHHQLHRRAIENYLPLGALDAWTRDAQGSKRPARRARWRKFRAFKKLTPAQRHHFHMKDGFGDGTAAVGTLFEGVPSPIKQALGGGFGKSLTKHFGARKFAHGKSKWEPLTVDEHQLRKDGAWDELRPFIEQLLARIR